MSRFMKVMIVLLAIAAFAAPAMADDMFSVGGEMKALGYYLDDGGDHSDTAMYQRLRVQGTFKANDNVSATFRTDFSEGDWGADANNGRFDNIKDMDRAYADVNFGAAQLRFGTQYFAFGKTTAVIANDTGAMLTFKPVKAFFAVLDDRDVTGDTDNADATLAGVNVAFGPMNVFLAQQNKNLDAAESVYELGATGDFDLDVVKLAFEANFFSGDAATDVDATGLQLYVDASMAASDAATVGAELFYAQGTDAADEVQYTRLGNAFGTWDPFARGPYNDEMFQVHGMAYDIFGANTGIMAVQGYADIKTSDAMTINASLAFAQTETDDDAAGNDVSDDAMILNVGGTYAVMANVNAVAHIQYADIDSLDDALLSAGLGLKVNF